MFVSFLFKKDLGSMLKIAPRSRTENELTDRIWIIRSIDQCDWSILSLSGISNRILTSWTQGLTKTFSFDIARHFGTKEILFVLSDDYLPCFINFKLRFNKVNAW